MLARHGHPLDDRAVRRDLADAQRQQRPDATARLDAEQKERLVPGGIDVAKTLLNQLHLVVRRGPTALHAYLLPPRVAANVVYWASVTPTL
jgi:hypothetical protein